MRFETRPSRFDPSRRRAVRTLAAACMAGLAGCAPVRIGLRAYPKEFKTGAADLVRAMLAAFTETVVPGVATAGATATLMQDPFYGFSGYAGYFASELDAAAHRARGLPFIALPAEARRDIVAGGLAARGVNARLFTGAVFLAQALSYSGAHQDGAPSPLLDFPGAVPPSPSEQCHYADATAFRAVALTADGNPA